MELLNDEVKVQVKDVLGEMMDKPVSILFFSSPDNCEYCEQTRQLLEEIVPLNSLLKMEHYDLNEHESLVEQFNVTETPAIVLAGVVGADRVDYGIRFYGIPAGHEFTSLINGIILVSRKESGLKPATRSFLGKLNKDILLRVFVTPT